MTWRHHAVLGIAALLFVWLHARTLPPTLEDEDTINLAMGVEEFNVARYRPHPPGYPVYIALGKLSTSIVTTLRPGYDRDRRAAVGLAWVSILSGAAGLFVFAWLWRLLGVAPWWASLAAIATAATPLYWFTAARPLTDIPGLVASVTAQVLLLLGLSRQRSTPSAALLAGGLVTGVAIGIRSQTMWLTLPLCAWVGVALLARRDWRPLGAMAAGLAAGTLIWFVPMVHLTGGLPEYLRILTGQGRHDFSGVEMLATHPSWRLVRESLAQTFLAPWQLIGWSWLVGVLGMAGLLRPAPDRWRHTAIVGLLVLPYLVFHLLFHEVETTRYSLPTAAMLTGLAVQGLSLLGRVAGSTATIIGVVLLAAMSHTATSTYAQGTPVFRVIREMAQARAAEPAPPLLEAHHRAWWATSRALDWQRPYWDLDLPRLVSRDETLRLLEYWRSGATTPIWFLSDPGRTDLLRFAPGATRHQSTYRLPPDVASLIGGLRTYDVGWYRLSQPDWMLGRGWSVTPELKNEPSEPHRAVAHLRRHGGPTLVFVGARYLRPVPEPVDITATLNGYHVARWTLALDDAPPEWFSLPKASLSGPGAYAALQFSVAAAAGDSNPVVAFDQFGASDGARPLLAFGTGWTSLAYDPDNPTLMWRQASRLSKLHVRHVGAPVRITLRGTVSPDEFEVPPVVVVTAGLRLLARFVASGPFEKTVTVTPSDLDAADGRITVATDLSRTRDERLRGTPDRQFGVRFKDVRID